VITLARLQKLAASSGFRVEPLEKVLRLLEILERLDRHEGSNGHWVLKGGTALNLFYLDLPRLSIDVDVNFTGVESVEHLPRARGLFERILAVCCERSGCSVRRAPSEHAGGKFRLRFPSLLGGTQNLEVDVSYVARVPLLAVERRTFASAELDVKIEAPCLSLAELAAGKFAALATRGAARDWFDALSLTHLDAAVLDSPGFRLAFLCQVAASRKDFRATAAPAPALSSRQTQQQLVPLLRVERGGATINAASLTDDLSRELGPVIRRLLKWSQREREFLDCFLDHGEIEPPLLTDDPALQTRILKQPMLQWKQMHVRARRK
jgi:hypothetical protein